LDEVQEEPPETAAIATIISNCKRLIRDAEIMLASGSNGSALSLAILAFEETGKGHREDLGIEKTKRTPSWHQFRQTLAGFVLLRSVLEKYEVKFTGFPAELAKELQARAEGAKTTSEVFRRPISDELRSSIIEFMAPASQHLNGDRAILAQLEMRYIRLLVEAAAKGEVEEARQKGMYVDVIDGNVTSDPGEIKSNLAFRWIFIAKRSLQILEEGDIMAPYSPLAWRFEEKFGLPENGDGKVLDFYRDLGRRVLAGEEPLDVYFSTLPETEQNEMKPHFPTIKALFKDEFERK
jgi:hypothetical protein